MWKALAGRRMQWQLALICLTGVLIAALSVFLISGAIRGAAQIVIGDAARAVEAAAGELAAQGAERAAQEADWAETATELKDVSLRGITLVVLRSYPGVEGGYWTGGEFLGYAFPTHLNPDQKTDLPETELREIQAAVEAARAGLDSRRVAMGPDQAVVISARYNRKLDMSAWAMKRVSGLADPREQQRRWWLAALVTAALVSIVATLAAAAGFARGVRGITRGLELLEHDYHHRLPAAPGELGEIARAVNRMIERREALEKELRREDRLRTMGRLVAAVAHEIRNPLNGMRLAAQLLKKQAEQRRIEGRHLDSIIAEVDRLEDLVREFLAFDQKRPPELKRQAVRPCAERAARLVAAQAERQGIAIEIEERGGPVWACYDEGRLTQVLLNLLLNSMESQGEGGWVRMEIEGGERASVRVTDSGPALSAGEQERLFEMFYSNKPGGAGLGLAVSRELMRQMNGDLEYDASQEHASFVVRMAA